MPLSVDVSAASSVGLGLFLLALLGVLCATPGPLELFRGRYGRRHRLMGLLYLCCLLVGVIDLWGQMLPRAAFDIALPGVGVLLTLSAAEDFGHERRRSESAGSGASGALGEHALVKRSEMIEHSFYQCVNVAQAIFLHVVAALGSDATLQTSALLLLGVTSPWAFRSRFPVNRFSANYDGSSTVAESPWTLVAVLYRAKKYQYLLYKHCLLHGLNISVVLVAVQPGAKELVVKTKYWQVYWLSLNCAYVMEFFLQTLVRRKLLRHQRMLKMNQALMLVSTVAAVQVLWVHVAPWLAAMSLAFNLSRKGVHCKRGHTFGEVGCAVGVFVLGVATQSIHTGYK